MQKYHIHGRYIALNKDGSLAGEDVYHGKLDAESPELAIKEAAACVATERDYRAIMWLYAFAEPMEGMSRWRKVQLFLISLFDR